MTCPWSSGDYQGRDQDPVLRKIFIPSQDVSCFSSSFHIKLSEKEMLCFYLLFCLHCFSECFESPSWFDFLCDIVCIFIKWRRGGLTAHQITPPCCIQGEYQLPPLIPVWSSLVNSYLPDNTSCRFYRQLAGLQVPQSRHGKLFTNLGPSTSSPLCPLPSIARDCSSLLGTNCREALGGGSIKKWQENASAHTLRTSAFCK